MRFTSERRLPGTRATVVRPAGNDGDEYELGLAWLRLADVRRRQDDYLASSTPVTAEMVGEWRMSRRLWNNTVAMLGPVL